MKKLLAIAIVLMMVPFSAFAMEMISDTDMDSVTGQAGVSIALANVQIYQKIEKIEYTDTDGFGGSAAGVLGIGEIEQNITLNAIAPGSTYGNVTTTDAKPLTIDVADLTGTPYAVPGTNGTAIVIGLPTLEITVSEFTLTPYLGDMASGSFGTITIGNQTIAILGGTIEIAAH